MSYRYKYIDTLGIRQSYFGETKPHNLPGVRDANLSGSSGALEDAKPPKVSGVFRVSAPPPLQLPAAIDSDFSRVRGSLGPRVQQNNSSEYAKNHVPVAFDYDHLEKSLCFANPANVSVVQPCPIRLRVSYTNLRFTNQSVKCTQVVHIYNILFTFSSI